MKEKPKVEFIQTWKINDKKFGLLKLPAPISPYNIRNDETISDEELEFIDELAESIKEIGLEQLPLCHPNDGIFVGRNRYFGCEKAGIKSILVEIRDISPSEQKRLSHHENVQRKNISWLKSAEYCKELRGKPKNPEADRFHRRYERTLSEISQITGLSNKQVRDLVHAIEVVDKLKLDAASAKDVEPSLFTEIYRTPEDDWKYLFSFTNKITRDELRKRITQGNKMKSRIELLETTHPELAKDIKKFWYPLKYETSAYRDMELEIGIKIGKPKMYDFYLDASFITEEEAKEHARKHHGRYLDTITKTYHKVWMVPNTVEELRAKWKKKLES